MESNLFLSDIVGKLSLKESKSKPGGRMTSGDNTFLNDDDADPEDTGSVAHFVVS